MEELSTPQFQRYRALKQKKYRHEYQLFLVEGTRLLQELLKARWPVECLLTEPDPSSQKLATSFPWPAYSLKKGGIDLLSEHPSPQKLIAVAHYRKPYKPTYAKWNRVLILDEISEPGNLGTLIRSATAFSIEAVFLNPQCTDPFHPKSLRASMGGVFHLPLHIHPDFDHLFKILEGQGYDLIGTSPHSKKNLNSHTFQPKTALLLGNEAHGSSYQRRIQKWLSIPTPGIESLNVAQAGSIFLYQWANPPLAQPH